MVGKAALTTGQVAIHCQVSIETVTNWVKAGKLEAFATPGGHRRIYVEAFRTFLRDHDMPPYGEEPAAKPRILVVDDEPDIIKLIVDILSRSGHYEIATASDGFEAGIQLTKFRPDLVVLDLMMPNINGFKVCKRIKSSEETRDVIVLVVTGYAQEENVQKAMECGADFCMAKPFSPMALLKKVDEFLQDRSQPSLLIPKVS